VAVNRSFIDDGLGFGKGFVASTCTNLLFENNTIFDFYRGATFGNSDNTVVRGNEFYGIRLDGMNFSSDQGLLIEGNHLHNFRRSLDAGEHSDMIQFWTTNGVRPSTDIVIRNNRLDIGAGDHTQSIFMRNEAVDLGRAGIEMYYRNVLIEGNTIYNDHPHGIMLGEATGVIIRNNSVLHADGRSEGISGLTSMPRISVASASTDVTIVNNLAASVPVAGGPGWTVENNLRVQDMDPNSPNCYGSIFITSTLDARDGEHRFVARADSPIELFGQGSAETRYAMTGNGTEAFFTVTECAVIGARRIFDATFMAEILGVADQTADYRWDFGCGHTASGKKVAHDYAAFGGGVYDVTLTIVLGNGTTRTGNASVPVHGELLVDFDPATGTFRKHSFGSVEVIATPAEMDGDAIQLGAPGKSAALPKEKLLDLTGSDDFDFHFTIKADAVGASGELFRHHMQYIATIDKAGELGFQVFTTDGKSTRVVTSGLDLNDGLWHNIDIQFRQGTVQLLADGVLKVEHTLSAPMRYNVCGVYAPLNFCLRDAAI